MKGINSSGHGSTLSAVFVLTALILAAELTTFRGGLMLVGGGGSNSNGPEPTSMRRGVGILVIHVLLNTESAQSNITGPGSVVPVAHLKVNIMKQNQTQVTRPIVLYTNRSGLITEPLSQGVYDVYGGDASFVFNATVNSVLGQTTHLDINVTRASHPVSFLLLNDSDGSGRVDVWESVTVQVPNDTLYVRGEVVYLTLTGFVFDVGSGVPSGGNVTFTIRGQVSESHLGIGGTWVTLSPDVGFSTGDYSSFYLVTNEPNVQVSYSNG